MNSASDAKAKPIFPVITDLNRPFWDGCRERRLMLQCCDKCGFNRYPAAPICPVCLSPDATWKPASGRGSLHSFVIFQRAYHPAWKDKVPYNVSLVEIEEGPILLTNVVGIKNEELRVGMALEVDFESLDETTSIPIFKPA
jgi:uncharacterized OB-fold protein